MKETVPAGETDPNRVEMKTGPVAAANEACPAAPPAVLKACVTQVMWPGATNTILPHGCPATVIAVTSAADPTSKRESIIVIKVPPYVGTSRGDTEEESGNDEITRSVEGTTYAEEDATKDPAIARFMISSAGMENNGIEGILINTV